MFVDTHAHLFFQNYEDDLDEVILRAKDSGVDYILIPATDISTAKQALEIADKYDFIYASVGIHPHESKDWNDSLLKEIDELCKHEKVKAIGEIGLDYHYDFSPKDIQIRAFKAQLDLAVEKKLPVIIHNRESDKDMMDIIRSYCSTGLKAQFHCYNGSLEDARELISMTHFISFTGNITFKKADDLCNILANLDLNNILLETDSPFMSPIPYRGKRNEPSYVKLVADKIAEIHKTTTEEVAKITSFNSFRMFGIGSMQQTSFTYKIGNSLYINVTNRCNADCVFCKRKKDPVLHGFNLGMTKSEEPPAEIYKLEIGDPAQYDEIVFCGFGEPTIRWDVVKDVAKYVKSRGGKTRLNTNGHGSYINKRNISPEMKGIIDSVSISINTTDPRQYSRLMQVDTRLFNEMISFAKTSKSYVDKVIMTVVSLNEVEIEKARKVVEEKVGVEFRVRSYFN